VAIVGQPYAPAFECGKREGVVAQVERERGAASEYLRTTRDIRSRAGGGPSPFP